jgi:hypothetical protein
MEQRDDVSELTVLKTTSPFKLGLRTVRIDGGK